MRKTKNENSILRKEDEDGCVEVIGITKNKKIEYDMSEEDANELLVVEQNLIKNKGSMCECKKNFSKNLYEARLIFKRGKGEGFLKWVHDCGMKKSTVYKLLDKYEIFIEFKTTEIFMLTEKNIASLKLIIRSRKFNHNEMLSMVVSEHKIRSYELDKVAKFLKRQEILNDNSKYELLSKFTNENVEKMEEEYLNLSTVHKNITDRKKRIEERMLVLKHKLDKKKVLDLL